MDIRKPALIGALLLASAAPASPAVDPFAAPQGAPAFLPVDEAFVPQPVLRRDDELLVAIEIAPDCYLYEHALRVEPLDPGVRLGKPRLEGGVPYHDEHFGDVRVHRQRLVARVPVESGEPRRVAVRYQGCADAGLCYPPQRREIAVEDWR